MKFKSIFSICLLTVCAIAALTFVHCAKEKDPASNAQPNQNVTSRDGDEDGTASSNFAVTYKVDGQESAETAFNALPETAYKHLVASPALTGEAADLVHVEAFGFTTRAGYEAWGDTKGYKIRQSLWAEDRLKFVADSVGLTETSVVPQWYIDYANEVNTAALDVPSPCYLGVSLWDPFNGYNGIQVPFFTPSTVPFQSLAAFYHKPSSCKFSRLTTCGTTTGHMKAWKWVIPVKHIMTISVVAGTGFNFINIFAPLNNKIGCYSHWGTF